MSAPVFGPTLRERMEENSVCAFPSWPLATGLSPWTASGPEPSADTSRYLREVSGGLVDWELRFQAQLGWWGRDRCGELGLWQTAGGRALGCACPWGQKTYSTCSSILWKDKRHKSKIQPISFPVFLCFVFKNTRKRSPMTKQLAFSKKIWGSPPLAEFPARPARLER